MDPHIEYIERFLHLPNPVLAEIDADNADPATEPNIGLHVGSFLVWLIHTIRAQRVLEFGACLGYSTIFLGEALRETGGALIAVESDEGFYRASLANVERAGLSDVVRLIHGDAAEVIRALAGPFDLILQDSAKPLYPEMLAACIDKLRPCGVLAADDALFVPMGVREKLAAPVHEYLTRVFADPRLTSTVLPIGDGLALSVRK